MGRMDSQSSRRGGDEFRQIFPNESKGTGTLHSRKARLLIRSMLESIDSRNDSHEVVSSWRRLWGSFPKLWVHNLRILHVVW